MDHSDSLNLAITSPRMCLLRKCTMSEVNNYLDDFRAYLQAYKEMLESKKPSGSSDFNLLTGISTNI
jgi:hypothetical protein